MNQRLNPERAVAAARTAVIGGLWDLILSAMKITAGVVWHSQALVADGIHSVSDLLSDGLVWFAGRHAGQAPDQRHPYGHGRFETVATLALGALLAAVAVGIAWDAGTRLFSPAKLLHPAPLAVVPVIVSILVKESLYWWTLGYARRVRSEMLRANAWHHRSDAVSSIIVLVGLVGTLAGLPYLDALAAVVVAVMVAKIAWDLGWGAIQELVDTGLEDSRLEDIRETIRSVGGVRNIHMLRTRRYGGAAAVDVHVLVDPRAAALARLERIWQLEPLGRRAYRTVLHYLNGHIDVELYLPLAACGTDAGEAKVIGERLRSAVRLAPAFNEVSVYFG
ncbi:MAG: cation diffusion facilitator family transporter [Chromatiaceae bacterium]